MFQKTVVPSFVRLCQALLTAAHAAYIIPHKGAAAWRLARKGGASMELAISIVSFALSAVTAVLVTLNYLKTLEWEKERNPPAPKG